MSTAALRVLYRAAGAPAASGFTPHSASAEIRTVLVLIVAPWLLGVIALAVLARVF